MSLRNLTTAAGFLVVPHQAVEALTISRMEKLSDELLAKKVALREEPNKVGAPGSGVLVLPESVTPAAWNADLRGAPKTRHDGGRRLPHAGMKLILQLLDHHEQLAMQAVNKWFYKELNPTANEVVVLSREPKEDTLIALERDVYKYLDERIKAFPMITLSEEQVEILKQQCLQVIARMGEKLLAEPISKWSWERQKSKYMHHITNFIDAFVRDVKKTMDYKLESSQASRIAGFVYQLPGAAKVLMEGCGLPQGTIANEENLKDFLQALEERLYITTDEERGHVLAALGASGQLGPDWIGLSVKEEVNRLIGQYYTKKHQQKRREQLVEERRKAQKTAVGAPPGQVAPQKREPTTSKFARTFGKPQKLQQ